MKTKTKVSKDQNTVTFTKQVTLQFVPYNGLNCSKCYYRKTTPILESVFAHCFDAPCTSNKRKDRKDGHYREIK